MAMQAQVPYTAKIYGTIKINKAVLLELCVHIYYV